MKKHQQELEESKTQHSPHKHMIPSKEEAKSSGKTFLSDVAKDLQKISVNDFRLDST